jgi:hypothetical protein
MIMAQVDSENSIAMPANDAGALYLPTDVTPEKLFQAIGRLRKEARDEIDRLIRFLDETDNHMEREPDGDEDGGDPEPSLGSFDRMLDQGKSWRQRETWFNGTTDLEADDAEDEPSLGSIGDIHHFDQERWATGGTKDLEDEHDGGEPDECGEPSLGSLDRVMNQEQSWHRENPLSIDMEQGWCDVRT